MGMTIDDSVSLARTAMAMMLVNGKPVSDLYKALEILTDTARKYQMMGIDYNARLRADMVAMFTDLQLSIQELRGCSCSCSDGIIDDVEDLIDEKINALRGNDND